MLKKNHAILLLFLVGVFIAAVSLPSVFSKGNKEAENTVSALTPTPELEVIHEVKGDKLYLEFRLNYFELSEEKAKPVYGEGHILLYIDGQEISKIYKRVYLYRGLTPGKHVVKVELVQHNHESYGIVKEFTVQANRSVKETFQDR